MESQKVDPNMIGVAFDTGPAAGGGAVSVTLEHWPTGKQVTLVADARNFGPVWNTESTARLWEQAFKLLETEVANIPA